MRRLLRRPVIAAVVLTGVRWYRYVTNTETPYDEVGVSLANLEAVRDWGCGKLKTTFGDHAPPPYGCGLPGEARQWR